MTLQEELGQQAVYMHAWDRTDPAAVVRPMRASKLMKIHQLPKMPEFNSRQFLLRLERIAYDSWSSFGATWSLRALESRIAKARVLDFAGPVTIETNIVGDWHLQAENEVPMKCPVILCEFTTTVARCSWP